MVRLLHLRNARPHPGGAILRRGQPLGRLHLHLARLRGRIRGASVRRAVLRAARRSHRSQVYVPHHHDLDGAGHVRHRPLAELRDLGHRGADHADRAAPVPGSRARRGVRRRRDLRRRARAQEPARLLHVVDSNHRDRRPVHGAAGGAGHPHQHGRAGLRRQRLDVRRLANSVPALGDPARGLDLDPAEAGRVAGLPAHEGGGPQLETAADGGLRAMGERQDRDPGSARRHRGRGGGLVRRTVLRPVLSHPDAESAGGDGADPDRGRASLGNAVFRAVRMAFRQDRPQAHHSHRLPAWRR